MENRVIYKYKLIQNQVWGHYSTEPPLPDDAEVVKFGDDMSGKWCIWAIILNGDIEVTKKRFFRVSATGEVLHGDYEFLETFIDDKKFVWTLWEIF